MNEFVERRITLQWADPRRSYDVVIIGGGGHGLATAYYLAERHRISDVAVIEAGYIGAGNSGRNTTIVRANYGIPEAVRFYLRGLQLFQTLEDELDCSVMYETKGIMWLAHTEAQMRAERARSQVNLACGAETVMITPGEAKELCPQLDLSGGGRYPVLGASYHPAAATARHDRVVWGYAQAAMRRGVHVMQHTKVVGLRREGGRITGVETSAGPISAKVVLSAVGGRVSTIAAHAGVRLPIRTHPLQAFVTNEYDHPFPGIVSDTELLCYVSRTERGQMLVGADYDAQASYSQRSSFNFLQRTSAKVLLLLPFMRDLRILRQWAGICDISSDFSPIMGETGVDGFLVTTGWGTWGFKAIPVGGEQMAELIATGRTPSLLEPFGLDRFAGEQTMADPGSAGTH